MRNDKGQFTKGNPGRPKGSTTKNAEVLRERISYLLDENYEQILDDLDELKPRERVQAWIQLLEYALPKLARTEMTVDVTKMTDEEIDRMINRISQSQ